MPEPNAVQSQTPEGQQVQAFASKVRTKYPGAYDDIDDGSLANKVVTKHPEYSDLLPKGFAAPQTTFEKERDPSKQPGILDTAISDVKGMGSQIGKLFTKDAYTAEASRADDPRSQVGKLASDMATRKAEGRSPAYRAIANVAQATGIQDPSAMEESARTGNARGVIGHALPPIAAALAPVVGEGLMEGAGKVAEATAPARNAIAGRMEAPVVQNTLGSEMKDLKYGRDPRAALVGEGIEGSTPERLLQQTEQKLTALHQAHDQSLSLPQHATKVIDIEPIIDREFAAAEAAAKKTGEPGLVTRLENVRDAMKSQYGSLQKSPLDANNFKREIGGQASWTGQPFDNEVNGFRVNVYRGIKDELNARIADPRVVDMNERSADLMSAKKALERQQGKASSEGIAASVKRRIATQARTAGARFVGSQYGAPEVPAAIPQNAAPVGRQLKPAPIAVGPAPNQSYARGIPGQLAVPEGVPPPNAAGERTAINPGTGVGKVAGDPAQGVIVRNPETPPRAGQLALPPAPERLALPPAPKEPLITPAPKSESYARGIPADVTPGKTSEPITAKDTPQTAVGKVAKTTPKPAPVPLSDADSNAMKGEIKRLRTKAREFGQKAESARVWTNANKFALTQSQSEIAANELENALNEGRRVEIQAKGPSRTELMATYHSAPPEIRTAVDEVVKGYRQLKDGYDKSHFERDWKISNKPNNQESGLPIEEKIARRMMEDARKGADDPKSVVESLGLIYKGEGPIKGSGMVSFEHPDHPGETATLPADKITPELISKQMDWKISEFEKDRAARAAKKEKP